MKLHRDKFSFLNIIGLIHGVTGIREDILEKDYGNTGLFLEMSGYKRLEETRRTGSDLADKKFSDFKIFYGMSDHTALRDAYQNMQKNYVFSEKDLLPFEFVTSQWNKLQEVLNDMEKGKQIL